MFIFGLTTSYESEQTRPLILEVPEASETGRLSEQTETRADAGFALCIDGPNFFVNLNIH